MLKKFLALVLCICIPAAILPGESQAAWNTVTLKQVQELAFANNSAYQKLESELLLLKTKYSDAVKSIWLKQKDMMTFRWSPLLNFQFPEWPDQADAYDWQYKPIQIQADISALLHEMDDIRYESLEKSSLLYTELYLEQEQLAFLEEQIRELEESIGRNELLLPLGEAVQSETDAMYQSRDALQLKLKNLKSEIGQNQKELIQMTGLVLSGIEAEIPWNLENPFISANIGEDVLPKLTAHMLNNSQAYYEAKMDTKLGLKSLEINEKLLKKQYGKKMQSLQSFINQAKQGMELDGAAFQLAYERFLEAADKPWNGSIRILFIKIPKEWFKGSLDGVRYIQDDPYVLYTAALEYVNLVKAEEQMKRELTAQAEKSYRALVSAEGSYISLTEAVEKEGRLLEKETVKNKLGLLTQDELRGIKKSYEELQMNELEALAEYSKLLYSFDRLTCGGVTAYLAGESLDTEVGYGGNNDITNENGEAEVPEKPTYYIRSVIEDQMFVFGISVPEGFTPEITSFELWVNEVQIGGRIPAGQPLRHLTLSINGIDTARVKLYNGEELVTECEIETMVSSAPLQFE